MNYKPIIHGKICLICSCEFKEDEKKTHNDVNQFGMCFCSHEKCVKLLSDKKE